MDSLMMPNKGAAGNSRCPFQLRLIYEIVRHTFISVSRSAAVPELWTLDHYGRPTSYHQIIGGYDSFCGLCHGDYFSQASYLCTMGKGRRDYHRHRGSRMGYSRFGDAASFHFERGLPSALLDSAIVWGYLCFAHTYNFNFPAVSKVTEMKTWSNQIAGANSRWPLQFRYRGSPRTSAVA